MGSSVSIVIPHCSGDFLDLCLASIFENDLGVDFEVIVVMDRQSLPPSFRWKAHLSQLIVTGGNHGFGASCNLGAERCRGEFVLFLNDDALLTPGCLKELVREMERNPTVAITGPKLRSLKNRHAFDYSGASGGLVDTVGIPFARGRILGNIEPDHGQYDTAMDAFWVSGACLLIRRAVFETCGGFFEPFYMQMEEVDLCWRAQALGYRVRCVPTSLVWHHGGFTLEENSLRKTYLNHRNNLRMLFRNSPWSDWPRLALRTAIEIASLAWVLIRPREWRHSASAFLCLWSFPLFLKDFVSRSRQKRISLSELPGYVPSSVVWLYYFKGLKTFSHLANPELEFSQVPVEGTPSFQSL